MRELFAGQNAQRNEALRREKRRVKPLAAAAEGRAVHLPRGQKFPPEGVVVHRALRRAAAAGKPGSGSENGLHDVVRLHHRLEQVIRDSHAARLLERAVVLDVRDDEDRATRILRPDAPDQLQPVHLRHTDVSDDDVRPVAQEGFPRRRPVRRLRHDAHSHLRPRHRTGDADAHQQLVLRDQHRIHFSPSPTPALQEVYHARGGFVNRFSRRSLPPSLRKKSRRARRERQKRGRLEASRALRFDWRGGSLAPSGGIFPCEPAKGRAGRSRWVCEPRNWVSPCEPAMGAAPAVSLQGMPRARGRRRGLRRRSRTW